jgi:hypothetical protein
MYGTKRSRLAFTSLLFLEKSDTPFPRPEVLLIPWTLSDDLAVIIMPSGAGD